MRFLVWSPNYKTALSSLKRVQELLHVQKEVDDGNQMIHHPIETIHFDHIYFSL